DFGPSERWLWGTWLLGQRILGAWALRCLVGDGFGQAGQTRFVVDCKSNPAASSSHFPVFLPRRSPIRVWNPARIITRFLRRIEVFLQEGQKEVCPHSLYC